MMPVAWARYYHTEERAGLHRDASGERAPEVIENIENRVHFGYLVPMRGALGERCTR